jgi:hypothetical protein
MPPVRVRRLAGAAIVGVALLAGLPPPSAQQNGVDVRESALEWVPQRLLPSGNPVIPIFEGWYRNPDKTYQLCFGYYNLNTAEAFDIPLGPDNFIEPRRFDGSQPTHFDPVPKTNARRYWCAFTVNLPETIAAQRVVWTLRVRGKTYAAPGHVTSSAYMLDEPDSDARGVKAPVVRFKPDGPEVRGRRGATAGPLKARVGDPLPVSVWVNPDPHRVGLVWWFKHQGPGDVTFSSPEAKVAKGGGDATTTATFTQPGEYLLRVQSVMSVGTLEFHCCWTNMYVRVVVGQ